MRLKHSGMIELLEPLGSLMDQLDTWPRKYKVDMYFAGHAHR